MRTVDKIQEVLDSKNIKASKMMKDLGFSSGLFSQWKAGKQEVSLDKIIKIADYLECSIDYLLGRTDEPTGKYSINGNNNTQAINHGDNSQITVTNEKSQDRTTEELLELIQALPLIKRAEAVLYLNSMRKGA